MDYANAENKVYFLIERRSYEKDFVCNHRFVRGFVCR